MNTQGVAKVAIIGGGCASITAAFELTRPELNGRYEVTLYQLGWRLGGKGASGRGPSGRIEEHGLHIWNGFYDNAFRLLRECYAELAPNPGPFDVADWRQAFIPENEIGLSARSTAEGWHSWSACFPAPKGLPGDPIAPTDLMSLPRYMSRAIDLVSALLRSVDSRYAADTPPATGLTDPERVLSAIGDLLGGAASASTAVLIEGLALLQVGLKLVPTSLSSPLTELAEWIARTLRSWFEKSLILTPRFQHIWEVMDIVVATMVGVLRFGLLTHPRGLDAINDYESRDWLRMNGASERSLQSPFIVALYNLAFSYADGDRGQPSIAAGQAVRGAMRMFFGYRGALFWRLRAGMGDVVFAPFHEALRRRGVRFEFFHRLTDARIADAADLAPGERPYVTALEFDVQAKVRDGAEYSPLTMVNGRPCWPSTPDFDQLEQGDLMRAEGRDFESHWDRRRVGARRLEVTRDFDFVVLGVSVAEVANVCRDIIDQDPRWRRMVEEVKTTETQAFQVWLGEDLEQLGWTASPRIGTAHVEAFDTWCDMAHTVPEEGWTHRPRTVVYFCSALSEAAAPGERDDPAYPERRREQVRGAAINFLRRQARALWPKAYDAQGEFRWEILVQPEASETEAYAPRQGVDRFDSQYWRANVNPTDRYVLSRPGSLKHRISPLDITYDNLTIAGDWTDCGFNEGCVEAAVMSGRLAAHALSGAPRLEDIVGYDHP